MVQEVLAGLSDIDSVIRSQTIVYCEGPFPVQTTSIRYRRNQMRVMQLFLQSFICVGLVASATVASLEGQSSVIWGPILGFTPSAGGTAISPILGVPGASTLADPLIMDGIFRGMAVSPKQDYAVAVRMDDRRAVVIDLA